MKPTGNESVNDIDPYFIYTGARTKEISFPLGGIGTGSIGLSGNGRLIDWEIYNRPNKLSHNGFSFFAVKAEAKGVVKVAKVLNGDLLPPYTGEGKGIYEGYGYGPKRENMAGFPHFRNTAFGGQFPIANITFDDPEGPLAVRLTSFNPFIPLNAGDSSLPVAVLTYEVTNRSTEKLDVSIVGNLTNPSKCEAVNTWFDDGKCRGFKLHSRVGHPDDPDYGDLSISTNCEDVSYQSYWYRGNWFDNATVFWKEFTTPGKFKERIYELSSNRGTDSRIWKDVCLLSGHRSILPGEQAKFTFVISWSFPNYTNYWKPIVNQHGEQTYPSWKNHYALRFSDSTQSARYMFSNFDRLEQDTCTFQKLLFDSTLPVTVIDAISSNLSILKSPTVLRLPDGTLYGFEGNHTNEGSCEGSCSHVWAYEQVTAFLFPELARSMRSIEYQYTQFENGKMAFRLSLPPERTRSDFTFHAAADGQMAGIIKSYREWKISGDTAWLKSIWPNIKKALEYAWDPTNEDWWDRDCDGVLEGVQHHTLDVEMYGPNTFLTSMYHSALLAASIMADALSDEAGHTYRRLFESGKAWIDDHLYNGEYYIQQIDLTDEKFPIDPELGEIKYQIHGGCHIDQVLGQWHAHIVGLGHIMDQTKVKSALQSIYKYNFIPYLGEYANACRIYGLNDERGLLICTWPHHNSPTVPVPYADECMNGFEYQAACHMIYEGLIEEGLDVVKAIRNRYDGFRRNPWNEFECGSNYVRSMASYSLLLALSGFEYDMTSGGHIGFSPVINGDSFQCFWSLGEGWGQFMHANGELRLSVMYGQLTLSSFSSALLKGKNVAHLSINNVKVSFNRAEDTIHFANTLVLKSTDWLTVCY